MAPVKRRQVYPPCVFETRRTTHTVRGPAHLVATINVGVKNTQNVLELRLGHDQSLCSTHTVRVLKVLVRFGDGR